MLKVNIEMSKRNKDNGAKREETEERHARRDEGRPEEKGKRSGWKRDAEYKRGGDANWRRPEHGHDGTKKKVRRRGKRRERKRRERRRDAGGEGGGRVSGARSLSDTLRRTDALLRSPLVAQKRV